MKFTLKPYKNILIRRASKAAIQFGIINFKQSCLSLEREIKESLVSTLKDNRTSCSKSGVWGGKQASIFSLLYYIKHHVGIIYFQQT